MVGKLLPFGYSVPDAQARLAELMQDEQAILCDIRYSVLSRNKPEWSDEYLRNEYGRNYLHIKDLGNVNYFDHAKPIQLANPDAGIPRLLTGLKKGYTIILLCTCPNYTTCHRKVVVDLVSEQMPDVEVVLQDQVEVIEKPVEVVQVTLFDVSEPRQWHDI